MSISETITAPPLPIVITKGELARYLGCHTSTVWRTYLTKDTLASWGYDYDTQVKRYHKFSVSLTAKIIEHFHITAERWHSIVSPHIISHRRAA
ncbi:MAG: hypothetical protein AAGJ82_07410 [Bacteroidota bacterium]